MIDTVARTVMLGWELAQPLASDSPKQRIVRSSPTKPFSATSGPAQCAGLFYRRIEIEKKHQ